MTTTHAPTAAKPTASANGAAAQHSETDRPIVYVNGKYVPKGQAMVSVYDHGLLYGDGVFEGIRIYNGRIFKSKQHMERLWKSAEAIRLKIPVSQDEMVAIQRECIRVNNIKDGYIRLIVSRGYGTLGLNPFKCPVAGVICIADQIALYPPEMYEQGMRVVIAERPRIPIACLDPRIKSLNYLNNILAKVEAIDHGCLECIMLNTEGHVSECSGDNIFLVKNGKLITPPTTAGILEGITREFVMRTLAPACGVAVEEKLFKVDELLAADEIFLTGSAAEMIAVTQIDTLKDGKVAKESKISAGEGPITRKLREKFRSIVTSPDVPEA